MSVDEPKSMEQNRIRIKDNHINLSYLLERKQLASISTCKNKGEIFTRYYLSYT